MSDHDDAAARRETLLDEATLRTIAERRVRQLFVSGRDTFTRAEIAEAIARVIRVERETSGLREAEAEARGSASLAHAIEKYGDPITILRQRVLALEGMVDDLRLAHEQAEARGAAAERAAVRERAAAMRIADMDVAAARADLGDAKGLEYHNGRADAAGEIADALRAAGGGT